VARPSSSPNFEPRLNRKLARAVKSSKAPAISRAAAVLRLLGKSEAPVGVHRIARELGIVPSTCLHVLRALVAEELVAFDSDTKRYSLDAGVLTLARHWLRRNRFKDLAQPILDQIGQTHGVTAVAVQISGIDHMVVVAMSQFSSALQISTQIGSRFPAFISATGRCIAAFGDYPESVLEEQFKTLRWDEPPTLAEWKAQIAETRERGVAVDMGNYISGVTVVAAPVWGMGTRLKHTLVAIGIGSALRKSGVTSLQKDVLAGAQALSRQLEN